MKQNLVVITLVLLGLLLPLNVEASDSTPEGTIKIDASPESIDIEINTLTPHDYIYINTDGVFASAGFPGNGSESNPYIIENYSFTVIAETAIRIQSTTVHFIIRNNYIDGKSTGISCTTVGTGNAVIEDNIIASHKYRGISIYNSPETVLDNNTVYDCEISGISVTNSPSTTLKNNRCYNCGFYFQEASLADYQSQNVTGSNWVNDKPYGYVKDSIDTDFAHVLWGQMFFVNFTNVGIYDMNINNVSFGIVGVYSTQLVIENCTFSNNTENGVYFYKCNESYIIECTFTDNDYGFFCQESTDITVIDSTFSQNIQGVYTDRTNDVKVIGNTFNNHYAEAILIQEGLNVLIDNNTAIDGDYSGIYITECDNVVITDNLCSGFVEGGLWVYYTSNINITFNTFLANDYGIYLEESSLVRIIYNLIENNTMEGVYLDAATSTTQVYWNTFRNNHGDSEQCCDDGTSNVWYNIDTLSGNWWSDYTGGGNYSISGSADSFDLYPLNDPPFPIPEYGYLGFLSILCLLSLSFVILQLARKK